MLVTWSTNRRDNVSFFFNVLSILFPTTKPKLLSTKHRTPRECKNQNTRIVRVKPVYITPTQWQIPINQVDHVSVPNAASLPATAVTVRNTLPDRSGATRAALSATGASQRAADEKVRIQGPGKRLRVGHGFCRDIEVSALR